TRFRIERRSFKNNIGSRACEPLIQTRLRCRFIIAREQRRNIDRSLTRAPAHATRRHSGDLPLDAIAVTQLRRLRNKQPCERTPNVSKAEKAKSVSFHIPVKVV